jgi:signal transduction histidine kinase
MLRAVVELGDDGVPLCERELTSRSSRAEESLRRKIRYFELGTYLRSIQVSGQRISSLIKGLKSYARPPVDRFEEIDLRDGIQDTLLILGSKLRNVNVQLDLPEIPKARCIAGEMHQVWTNILSNACDAIDGKGAIAISCGSDRNNVWVTLRDSGPGIPGEIADNIFKPNFTTKTSSGNFGLGLGLAIAKDIVQKHGGAIAFENVREGGAKFTVTLPAPETHDLPGPHYQ